MKYTLNFITYGKPANEIISRGLKLDHMVSIGTLIDVYFADTANVKDGVFRSKKAAQRAAQFIEMRGKHGGYSDYVRVEVVPCA